MFVSARKRKRSLLLYVAYTAAHWPMHALSEDIAKHKGRFEAGYDAVRQARFARLKELGLIDPAWRLSPTEGDWAKVAHRAWEFRRMEVYAAMLDRMDQGIGRIVAELKRHGRLDNTLVLFLQDNGGCAENMGRQPPSTRPGRPIRANSPASRPNRWRASACGRCSPATNSNARSRSFGSTKATGRSATAAGSWSPNTAHAA